MSTIYALATARGKAGIGVIRVSGPDAFVAAERLAGPLPSPRRAGLRALRGPGGTMLDRALVLLFPEGASFTGEPTAELHCHGAPAVLDAVLGALGAMPELEPAEPGAFTRRALENDRMDLAQVEGLADLLDAETEAQRAQAWRVFDGGLGEIVERWRADLIHALALVEATIDFVDDDVPEDVWPEVDALVAGVLADVRSQTAGVAMSERIRDGFEVAIVGPPNSGKSTLLNCLSGRDAAITSDVAGTTRDVLEVRMDLGGLPVTILDTAGLRDGGGAVERLGMTRARERADAADLRVMLLPRPGETPVLTPKDGDLIVLAKIDRHPGRDGVSGLTGAGVGDLIERISDTLARRSARATAFTRHRHEAALVRSIDDLSAAASAERRRAEITAGHLWSAVRALEAITGRVDLEHVLDEVFSTFCLGK